MKNKEINKLNKKQTELLFDLLTELGFIYTKSLFHIFCYSEDIIISLPKVITSHHLLAVRHSLDMNGFMEMIDFHHMMGIEQVQNTYYWINK